MLVENDIVEFKSVISADVCKEVVAFANTQGGTLYIGIDDDGNVSGIEHTDDTMLRMSNMIRDTIKPDVTMFVKYDINRRKDKQILVVTVQKGTDRPYYLAGKGLRPGGVFVRNGSSSEPATDTAIRKMIKETDGDSFESMRSLEQSLTFNIAKSHFARRSLSFDQTKMKSLGMILSDGVYSNVAMLLSDQCSCMMKAATFSGVDRTIFKDRREFSGSLFQQMEDLYEYIELRNQTRATFDGLYRIDSRDYPEEAIREALLNSIVHRDYSYSASTLVGVYDDRIEFVSVGGLATGIELEDILLGISICRNPKLAGIFYRLELIEAYGTGIPKIMNAYQGSQRKPKIEVTNNAFKITLPNRNAVLREDSVPYPNQGEEAQILELIQKRGHVIRSDVDSLLGVSQATSSRILKQMILEGKIRAIGKGKNIKYILLSV